MRQVARFNGLLCIAMCIVGCANQPDSLSRSYFDDPKQAAESARRLEAIRREIALLRDHPWAGEYCFGDGLGVNVTVALAPKSGFVYEWKGCCGVYDRNYGDVTADADRIRLRWKLPDQPAWLCPELRILNWAGRRYLIGDDQWAALCNEVNSGVAYDYKFGRSPTLLLRDGDADKRVTGLPPVPVDVRKQLFEEPIIITIIRVGSERNADSWPVTLDMGRRDGAFSGMQVFGTDSPTRVAVTQVGESSSEGLYRFILDKTPAPTIGASYSTRLRSEFRIE